MKKGKERRITGILSKHCRGFGFVIPKNKEETQGRDIFISPADMESAMDKDTVTVRICGQGTAGSGIEGKIEKIIERANKEVVGTFVSRRGYGFIIPEYGKGAEEVLVLKKDFNGAKSGDKVVADMVRWPSKGRQPEARIKEVISRKGEAGGDIKALIRAFQVREVFPERVKSEATAVPQVLKPKDLEGRRDLREKNIITIDGADAKDLDDAVSVERLSNGNYLLGVHIADVSHYVKEDAPLDKEALKRGTSIYLIDWVIPMLPQELSNGICSLHPGVDRLTLSVSMEIDSRGEVVSYDIFESVIRSKERMVYTDVSDMLENGDEELIKRYGHIYEQLKLMEELASILRKRRQDRGSLDFDIDEAHITLNEKGIPVSVEAAERRTANRIIEEFMLAANETIATHFFHLELPFVYRIHEKPAPEEIAEFKRFLQGLGLQLKGNPDNIHPKALNEVLNEVRDTGKEHVVNSVMLRSMKKAAYSVECMGHFGLGMKYYCHFTSPIRRYPDLIIHRIIKEYLNGNVYGSRIKKLKQKTLEAADQSSMMERKAEELEREVERLKKAEYMTYHVDEEYDGIISGVASFGFFVQIEGTIEGLVKVDSLDDDYYIYEAEAYRFIGRNNRKTYTLGDPVSIRVDSVDLTAREINFVLSDPDSKRME
ncbi:MAG: ribonuclease R [Anaerovoracaceae bacterium]|jgi:ribonuclease R